MSKPSPRILALLLAVTALGGSACGEVSEPAAAKSLAARLEPIEGTTFKRVVLVPKAVERLDIQTSEVRPATPLETQGVTLPGQTGRMVMPYDAVLYDKAGAAFTYINPKPLEYVRQPITLDGIKDKLAIVAAGPPTGTRVVTIGGIELYGVETGVGK